MKKLSIIKKTLIITVLVYGTLSCTDSGENLQLEADDQLSLDYEDGYYRELWKDEYANMNGRVGGQLVDETSATAPGSNTFDIDYVLPYAGYVLTGIGIASNHDKVKTLHLERRYLNADGSMGTRYLSKHGSKPNDALENAFYSVPDGYVIVGLGGGIKDGDIKRLDVHYMEIGMVNGHPRLVGQVLTMSQRPDKPIEREVIPGNMGYDINRSVITGVALKEGNDNLHSLKLYFAYLKE